MEGYRQFLYPIVYHLAAASTSEMAASENLRHINWTLNVKGTMVIFTDFKPESLVRNGDSAIREACSAIDTFLCLVNFILELKVPKKKVSWEKSRGQDGTIKGRLKKLGLDELHDRVNSIFLSVGYSLLRDYRNWVTHRGAPRMIFPNDSSSMVVLPKEISDVADESKKTKLIENYLLLDWPNEVVVECWPFSPPVALKYSTRINEAKEDTNLPGGIHIGKGAKDIIFRDVKITNGSLTDNREEFNKKNRVRVEKGQREFAGESIAIYSASDYINSIRILVYTIHRLLGQEFDNALCETYLRINNLNADSN